MTHLTSHQRLALRALALASAAVVFASGLPRAACAQTPASAPTAPATEATKLFPDSRIVTRDRISVEVVGRGPDIVLIPGLASSRETWRRTAERLRGRYRLHLVNVAGFAGEPVRANATGPFFDPVLEDIAGYIADARIGAPIVMGHSLGGTLGLALAERHPDRVSRLFVVDALPFFGSLMGGPNATAESVRPMVDAMTKGMGAAPLPEAQHRAMIAAMVTAPADVDRVLAWGRDSDGKVVAVAMHDDMLTDLRPGLAALQTPTTVIYPWDPKLGYPEAPFDANYQGFKSLPHGRLIRVDGSRHFIMYDQPARFDAEVDTFLKGG